MSDYLLVHREGGVLTLTFNRVEKKNALLGEMYTAMADALEQAMGDDSITRQPRLSRYAFSASRNEAPSRR